LYKRTAPNDAALHHERLRRELNTPYRLVQQHLSSFIARTEASTGVQRPRCIKDEFDAFLACSIVSHGFLRLRCLAPSHPQDPHGGLLPRLGWIEGR
jgi:hypothetical protein